MKLLYLKLICGEYWCCCTVTCSCSAIWPRRTTPMSPEPPLRKIFFKILTFLRAMGSRKKWRSFFSGPLLSKADTNSLSQSIRPSYTGGTVFLLWPIRLLYKMGQDSKMTNMYILFVCDLPVFVCLIPYSSSLLWTVCPCLLHWEKKSQYLA